MNCQQAPERLTSQGQRRWKLPGQVAPPHNLNGRSTVDCAGAHAQRGPGSPLLLRSRRPDRANIFPGPALLRSPGGWPPSRRMPAASAAMPQAKTTQGTVMDFGRTADGAAIKLYTLTNGRITATVTDIGAVLVALEVPDRAGKARRRRPRLRHPPGVRGEQALLRRHRRAVRQPDRRGQVHRRRQGLPGRRDNNGRTRSTAGSRGSTSWSGPPPTSRPPRSSSPSRAPTARKATPATSPSPSPTP